jgi:hypothetical protein
MSFAMLGAQLSGRFKVVYGIVWYGIGKYFRNIYLYAFETLITWVVTSIVFKQKKCDRSL